MSDDDYSCIKEVTKRVPITLSTSCQGTEIAGISQILDSWKCRYIKQLQGIVVSYRNVTLISINACIKSDYPVIMCNVKATFELFIPTVGSIVKGKINRISHDYIGCLVHSCINVAIYLSLNEYDSISHFISLDKIILLEITHIGFKRKFIRLKGKITEECVNLMKNMYSSIEETDAVHQNMLTNSQELNNDTDSEEHKNNDNVNLFDINLNDTRSSSSKKKKKKSNKLKPEQIHNSHFESLGTENRELSPSLLGNSSRLSYKGLNEESHDSSGEKKEKSNVQTGYSNFEPYESTLENGKFTSPNSLLSESVSLLTENSTDRDSYHSKKKKKRKDKSKSGQGSDELLVSSSSDFTPSNCYSPKKKKSKKDNSNSSHELLVNSSFDLTPASNCYSPKKKKAKKDSSNSSDKVFIKEEYSTDTCTDASSSSKKKKHKKSKSNTLSSPPLFSDSQSSSKEEIGAFKIPKSSSKKQQRVSKDKFSANEKRTNLKDLNSSLHENVLNLSISLKEKDIKKEENVDELIEALSCYDPSLGNEICNEVLVKDEPLDPSKKAKKRKHESPDKDGLPKKKKKIEENEVSLAKSSNKHKTKKKSKEKSEKDSKKDKKKSKKRVISSKKKLPKLAKKKKVKGEKLKKKLKKKSKHKTKDVP